MGNSQAKKESDEDFQYTSDILRLPPGKLASLAFVRVSVFEKSGIRMGFDTLKAISRSDFRLSDEKSGVGFAIKGVDESVVQYLKEQFPSESKSNSGTTESKRASGPQSKAIGPPKPGNRCIFVSVFVNNQENCPDFYQVPMKYVNPSNFPEVENWHCFTSFHHVHRTLQSLGFETSAPVLPVLQGWFREAVPKLARSLNSISNPVKATSVSLTRVSDVESADSEAVITATTPGIKCDSSSLCGPSSLQTSFVSSTKSPKGSQDERKTTLRLFVQIFKIRGAGLVQLPWTPMKLADHDGMMWFVQGLSLDALYSITTLLEQAPQTQLTESAKRDCNYFAYFYCDRPVKECSNTKLQQWLYVDGISGSIYSEQFPVSEPLLLQIMDLIPGAAHERASLLSSFSTVGLSLPVDADKKLSSSERVAMNPGERKSQHEIYIQVRLLNWREDTRGVLESKDNISVLRLKAKLPSLAAAYQRLAESVDKKSTSAIMLNDHFDHAATGFEDIRDEAQLTMTCFEHTIADPTAYVWNTNEEQDAGLRQFRWDWICSYEDLQSFLESVDPQKAKNEWKKYLEMMADRRKSD